MGAFDRQNNGLPELLDLGYGPRFVFAPGNVDSCPSNTFGFHETDHTRQLMRGNEYSYENIACLANATSEGLGAI